MKPTKNQITAMLGFAGMVNAYHAIQNLFGDDGVEAIGVVNVMVAILVIYAMRRLSRTSK